MKKLFKNCYLLGLFSLLSSTSFSQVQVNNNLEVYAHRSKIVEVFGDDFLSKNPDLIAKYNDAIETRIRFVQETLTSTDKYPLLSSFPLMNKVNSSIVEIDYSQFNPQTFNPLYYNLPFFANQTTVIRVDGTDYILIIDPVKK